MPTAARGPRVALEAANTAAQATPRRSKRLPIALPLLLLAVCVPVACRTEPSPESPRQVVVYCSVDQQIAEPILARFEQESGVKVLPRFDTEAAKTVGLAQRIRTEAARPAADVFWSGEVFHTVRLAREGLLMPYRGTGETDLRMTWPRGLVEGKGRWYGFALRARVIAYHTGRVTAEEAPARLEDLLAPKWKDRVVMASPEAGTTSGHVAALFVFYGPKIATEILKALKANGLRLVAGNSTAVRTVATGQADVCLTDTDDVYAAQRNGWPVAMKPCMHGSAGALAIPNTVALVKGAPHPEAARDLMAFLLGENVERMLAESDSHNTPVHEAVAKEFPAYAIPNRLPVDYEKVADALPDAIETATKILR